MIFGSIPTAIKIGQSCERIRTRPLTGSPPAYVKGQTFVEMGTYLSESVDKKPWVRETPSWASDLSDAYEETCASLGFLLCCHSQTH